MNILKHLKTWSDALRGRELERTFLRNREAADRLDALVKEMLRK